jgi:hypothetical protein
MAFEDGYIILVSQHSTLLNGITSAKSIKTE